MKNKTVKWIYNKIKKYFPAILIKTVLEGVYSVSFVVLALFSKDIIDVATGETDGKIVIECIKIGVLLLTQVLLRIVDNLLTAYLNGKIENKLQSEIYASYTEKKYAYLRRFHSGEVVNRLTSDLDFVLTGTVSLLPQTVYTIAKIISAVAAIAVLSPTIAAISVAFAVIIIFAGRVYGKYMKSVHRDFQKSSGRVRSFLQECVENIIVVKSYSNKNSIVRKLDDLLGEKYKLRIKRAVYSSLSFIFLFACLSVGYYVVLAWGAFKLQANLITYGTLMALLQLFQQLRAPLNNASGILPSYFSMIASAERIKELEDLPPEEGAGESEAVSFDCLKIENVSFGYNEDDGIVIDSADLQIDKGDAVLIVGKSGIGKSTLFKLLLSFYDYNGKIYFKSGGDEYPLTAKNRCMFAYVPQGNFLLSGTIRENISFGSGDKSLDDIKEAARVADILDFIENLPNGFDTVLGERGMGLSEGQNQRLAIARAVLSDSPILLLDECTSALDEQTELKVLANIKNLKTKTVILISHKNAAFDVCDKVVSIKSGRVSMTDISVPDEKRENYEV